MLLAANAATVILRPGASPLFLLNPRANHKARGGRLDQTWLNRAWPHSVYTCTRRTSPSTHDSPAVTRGVVMAAQCSQWPHTRRWSPWALVSGSQSNGLGPSWCSHWSGALRLQRLERFALVGQGLGGSRCTPHASDTDGGLTVLRLCCSADVILGYQGKQEATLHLHSSSSWHFTWR